MANKNGEAYLAMVEAIAAYMISMETMIEDEPDTSPGERLDPEHIDDHYVADRLTSESDVMLMVAQKLKAAMLAHRAAKRVQFSPDTDPRDVLFCIVTDKGYDAGPGKFTMDIAEATGYQWSTRSDVLLECMESIVFESGGWFKVVMMAPAKAPEPVYTIKICESQRKALLDIMGTVDSVNDMERTMMVDLRNLPEDSKHMDVVTLFGD